MRRSANSCARPDPRVGLSAAQAFTRSGVRRGFVAGQPLAPGILVYGMVFGMLSVERGLAWLEAVLMSVFVYSGSAQLAVLGGWSASPLWAPLMATVVVMNARYVLYGAILQPWLAGANWRQILASIFFLGDANWPLCIREYQAVDRDAGFVLGSGIAMYMPWLLGTVIGHVLGYSLPRPERFGLDFMLVAFATAIAMILWRGKSDVWPGVAALATALALHRWLPGGWYIVGAGLAAGCVGAARGR
jgi:4-azaleucine resistance transporter AzlC